jgi:hypothetical protein
MPKGRPLEVEQELLEVFTHSGRVSEYLVEVLPAPLCERRFPPAAAARLLRSTQGAAGAAPVNG